MCGSTWFYALEVKDVIIGVYAGIEQGGVDWALSDLLVKISSHYHDSSLADKVGQIRNISGNVCNVYVADAERVVGFTIDNLEPITPERGDKV